MAIAHVGRSLTVEDLVMRNADLKTVRSSGEFIHQMGKKMLHALDNHGGTLKELEKVLADEERLDAVLNTLARRIIGGHMWKLAEQVFDLNVDFDTPWSEFAKAASHRMDGRSSISARIICEDRNLPGNRPDRPCRYRLHHIPKALSSDKLSTATLPERMEHAAWRELFTFAAMMQDVPMNGYDVLALGSHRQFGWGVTLPRVFNEGNVWFAWSENEVPEPSTRRFVLVRVYPETSAEAA